MFNKVIFIGRLGKNAEVKTAQNNKECVVFSLATSESWKDEKGDYETAPNGIACMPGAISPTSPRRFKKGSSSPLRGKSSIARFRKRSTALRSSTSSPRSTRRA